MKFNGKGRNPAVALEAVADGELWIWAVIFGQPGSLNYLNVLECSKIVEKILKGELLPDFTYTVKGKKRKLCYYLVDGIYQKWCIFIDNIYEAITRKDKHFSAAQEGMQKDVERAFDVLISRWHILKQPCNLWHKRIMVDTMNAFIILQNMIVEARREGYKSEIFEIAREAAETGMFIDENVPRSRSFGDLAVE